MLQAVLWDVGGTLVDTVQSRPAFTREALAAAGIEPDLPKPAALRRAAGYYEAAEPDWRTLDDELAGYHQVARYMLAGSGIGEGPTERLAAGLADYYDAYALVPGVDALLDRLDTVNITLAVVSNWPPSLNNFLAHHGLLRHFEVVVGSAEAGICKPDHRLLLTALARLSVQPGDAVFIGNDPVRDIAPAQALGLRTIHFDPRRQHADVDCRVAADLQDQLLALLE